MSSTLVWLAALRPRVWVFLGLVVLSFTSMNAMYQYGSSGKLEAELRQKVNSMPEVYRYNYLFAHTEPSSWDRYIEMFPNAVQSANAPNFVDALLDSTWMGNFPIPELNPPEGQSKLMRRPQVLYN